MAYFTIGKALIHGELILNNANILHPRRHAELLLESATKRDRVSLYMNTSIKMDECEATVYSELLERRSAGEPIQYIIGTTPFYGREFRVGKGVFIPRFDSEVLIEKLLTAHNRILADNSQIEILDLCCGSGALGLTAALEILEARITLVDNSSIAIDYTTLNADHHGIANRVEIVERDVLKEFPKSWYNKFDFILANPPYISLNKIIDLDEDVQNEPQDALTDGGTGLSFYQNWGNRLNTLLKPNGVFIFEIDDFISTHIHSLMGKNFSSIAMSKDLSGKLRVCEAAFI
jgi:release factor glutamine methyltransferase